jgi:F-type H+-transporting ATPase subunit delta
MKEVIVSRRYAKSVFELALEMKILEQVKADMALIHSVCLSNRDFVYFLKSPVIIPAKKVSILKSLFESKVQELTIRFLVLITKKGRESIIQGIAEQFIILYKEHHNIISAILETAVPIDRQISKKVVQLLEKQTEANIELAEEVKEELIGGFVLNFDDKKYDASIYAEIQELYKEFNVNLFSKEY